LQHKLLGEVSTGVHGYLNKTLDAMDYKPNRIQEIEAIRGLVEDGQEVEYPDSTVDVFVKKPDGTEIYIDITTVKPNKKEFRILKRKILMWTAMRLSVNPSAKVEAYIAIPYNPESSDYSRHSGYYDRKDILVGDELWELVSNSQYNVDNLKSIFASLHDEVSEEISALLTR
jgi:hypothetical protein